MSSRSNLIVVLLFAMLFAALTVLGCSGPTAPTPVPSARARLVDAAELITRTAAEVQAQGYRVVLTLQQVDTLPPKVGVIIFPK